MATSGRLHVSCRYVFRQYDGKLQKCAIRTNLQQVSRMPILFKFSISKQERELDAVHVWKLSPDFGENRTCPPAVFRQYDGKLQKCAENTYKPSAGFQMPICPKFSISKQGVNDAVHV